MPEINRHKLLSLARTTRLAFVCVAAWVGLCTILVSFNIYPFVPPALQLVSRVRAAGDILVYQDSYISPWADGSYGGTATPGSTDIAYGGSANSLKGVMVAWGTVSPQAWSAPINISSGYTSLGFAVYGNTSFNLSLALQGPSGYYPGPTYTVPAQQWTVLTAPLSAFALPDGFIVDRIYLTNSSSTTVTFYLDDIRFIGTDSPSSDTTAPNVSVTHSPSSPSSSQTVTYTATATDLSGIRNITIFVDNASAITCTGGATTCTYIGGPYAANTTHTYYATAADNSNNSNVGYDPASGKKNFIVGSGAPATSGFWITGYYPNFEMYSMPPDAMDYGSVTHIIHFALGPVSTYPYFAPSAGNAADCDWRTAGNLAPQAGGVCGGYRDYTGELINNAHQHGVKVLLGIADVSTYGGSQYPMHDLTSDSAKTQAFVSAVLAYAQTMGYDGVDVNWEFPGPSDFQGYSTLMQDFRNGLDAWSTRGTLMQALYPAATVTVPGQYGAYNLTLLNQIVDQNSIELYGLQAWQTNVNLGYTSALNPGTVQAPGGSYDAITYTRSNNNWQNSGPLGLALNGWDKSKLAPGVGFLYYHQLSSNPLLVGGNNVGTLQNWTRFNYGDVIGSMFGGYPEYYDPLAHTNYKQWNDSAGYHFLTYETPLSVAGLANWTKNNGFGGMMIYELGTGYIPPNPNAAGYIPGYSGDRHPLLHALWNAVMPNATNDTTAPASDATVSGSSILVSATASDNAGVSGVQFKLDGTNLGSEDTSSPYSTTWSTLATSNSSHILTAVARDAAGNQTTSSAVTVTVNNVIISPPPFDDTIPPIVSLTAPANNATVSGSLVAVSATASDNVGVVGVQFKLNGTSLGAEDIEAPYAITWNTTGSTNGSYALSAVAHDSAGNSTTSAVINVVVANTVVSSGGGGSGGGINSFASATPSPAPVVNIIPTVSTQNLERIRAVLAREKSLALKIDSSLVNRLKGRILLQVQEKGEAWYVDPISTSKFYLADGPTAYQALRQFGLGIKTVDLKQIPVGQDSRFQMTDTDSDGLPDKLEESLKTDPNKADTDGDGFSDSTEVLGGFNPLGSGSLTKNTLLINRLRGRILLQVESKGEAWYINPVDGKRYYLADGEAAYQVMRYLSLGITNSDLHKIGVGEIE